MFDPNSGVLESATGDEVNLRPQTRKVLQILVSAEGELVVKDRLMSEVWNDTHVTDDSLVQCISEIRKALGPSDGRLVKTIPKQGYKLETTAGVFPVTRAAGTKAHGALLAAAVAALVAFFGWLALPTTQAPPATRSIAVLPFEDLAEDDSYVYFSSGITEDLVVSLSKVQDLRVVSRSTAAAAANDIDDPRDIADALKVEYLVDGSVRRTRDSLRMTAALVNGRTGENLWAESYEGSLEDIFTFQDAVLDELVRTLAVRLSPAERDRLGIHGTDDVVAYDQYLRGMELQNFLVPTANLDAEAAFREAIRLDPGYAAAHAYLSLVLSNSAEYGWAEDRRSAIKDAVFHANKAIELNPELPFARLTQGRLKSRRFINDDAGALEELQKAIDLDPEYIDAYAFKAIVLISSGRADEAREAIEAAFERNPKPPYWYYVPRGISNYYLGDYEAAEAALLDVLERNPNSPHSMRTLIATYGRMGNVDEAEWMAMEYEALGHTATISAIMESSAIDHEPYREAFSEGLRMAGLPE